MSDPLGPYKVEQVFNFVGISFRPLSGPGQAHSGEVVSTVSEYTAPVKLSFLHCKMIHVPLTGLLTATEKRIRASPRETQSVATQKSLACTRVPRKGYTNFQVTLSSSKMVARGRKCALWPTSTPLSTYSAAVYRCIK